MIVVINVGLLCLLSCENKPMSLHIKEKEPLLYKRTLQMDDQTSSVLVDLLDTKTKFNYLNYYYHDVNRN